MKKYFLPLLVIAFLGLTACASSLDKEASAATENGKNGVALAASSESRENNIASDDKSSDSDEENAVVDSKPDDMDLREKIKEAYGFPCRFWLPEGQELFCVYIYEDHAGYLWAAETEQNEYDDLSWTASDDRIDITGEWEDSFTVDMENGTATSLSTGKEYEIVKGLTQ